MEAIKPSKVKIALLQTKVDQVLSACLQNIQKSIEEAAASDAKICILGETFNCPYTQDFCNLVAEDFSKQNDEKSCPTLTFLKNQAQKHKIYLLGSIPQKDSDSQLFNTAIAINPEGKMIGQHRKVHLFDIDIPGQVTYKESDTFSPGDEVTVFETEFCKIGMAICYDIRFAELGLLMRRQGAQVLVYPSSFSCLTGEAHFELLVRARALDNQVYCVGPSVARFVEDPAVFQAFAHSTVVDPFGKVICKAGIEPTILYVEIDLDYVQQIRTQIPIGFQRRSDIYDLVEVNQKE